MKVVWKYPLAWVGEQFIDIPKGAKALSVGAQGNIGCLYALVDPDAPEEQMSVCVVTTDYEFEPGKMEFVGTFTLDAPVFHEMKFVGTHTINYALVFHVFADLTNS